MFNLPLQRPYLDPLQLYAKQREACKETGMKFDSNKNRLDLIQWPFVEDLGRVLTYGAQKYAPNNWQHVEGGEDRYFAAAMRHLLACRAGEAIDPETGLPHLAHAGCNLMFLHHLTKPKEQACLPTENSSGES